PVARPSGDGDRRRGPGLAALPHADRALHPAAGDGRLVLGAPAACGEASMTAPREVTVAVVSWNTRDLLAHCLDSLAREVRAGTAEAWVVDNASADGSPALVREHYPWARLLALDENVGFGAAVNLVADRTESPWLAVANAD